MKWFNTILAVALLVGGSLLLLGTNYPEGTTGLTALNNATENEMVTVGATTTELDAEGNLTFDGSTLALTGNLTLTTDLVVAHGGTGASSLTDGGVLLGSGTGAITALGQPTSGQLVIGSSGSDPILATITATANKISVVNGGGSITLSIPDAVTLVTPTITGTMVIVDGQGILIGHATAQAVNFTALTQVLGTANADTRVTLGRWSADANAPGFDFIKSQHATIGSNTVVADNDRIGTIRFFPDDGTDFATLAANFLVEVDDASGDGPSTGDVGTAFVWQQMPGNGGGAVAETMRLTASGTLTLAAALSVATTSTLTGDVTAVADAIIDDQLAVGGAVVTGAKMAIEFADVQRNPIDGVGHTLEVPADSMVISVGLGDDVTEAIFAAVNLGIPTYTATAGTTTIITDAATLRIVGAPVGGAEVTLTNAFALWVEDGTSRFDGTVSLEPVSSVSLINTNSNSDALMRFEADRTVSSAIAFQWQTASTNRMILTDQAMLVVGDDTANANMTIGLTINQGSNANNIIAFKSSNVAHGGLTLLEASETDTYAVFALADGNGGLLIESIQDSTTADFALRLSGLALDADVDAVDTATRATLEFFAAQHDSAGTLADMEAGAAVFAMVARISGGSRTIFVVDEDGDTFIDGTGPTAFDSHRDAELLEMFEAFYIAGRQESNWDAMVANFRHEELAAVGLVGELNEEDWNAGIRPLVPLSAQLTLLSGTARQEHAIMNALMDVLESDPQFRGRMRAAMVARGIGHLARP